MDTDGGWKKTLRNFGLEAKRAAERTTAQAMSRMGLSGKSPDPDPAFEQLAETYTAQTAALKSVRDAASGAVESLARVAGAGATLAVAVHAALPPGSAAIPAAERHIAAQRALTDGPLRRAEQRIHARIEAQIEEEIAAARDISALLDQRRKIASDYRRYRARLDDFAANESSEDAVKADDKLRELTTLAESLTDQIVSAMPKRSALLERCATELAEILRDFHLEAASGLDAAVYTEQQLPSTSAAAATDATSPSADDLLGGGPSTAEHRTSSDGRPSRHPRPKMSAADTLKAAEARRSKSAYTPVNQGASIWDEDDPNSPSSSADASSARDNRRPSARAPDYYGVASGGASSTATSTIPEPLRRRGDSSGYPTGGVGQRESTGRSESSSYPSGGVGQRESTARDDTYPTTGNGQKTSVYPSRRAPTTRAKQSKPDIPRSSSRDSGLSGKNAQHITDDFLGSFGGSTSTMPNDPPVRPPRQRRSAGATAASSSLDDLFNFTGSGASASSSSARPPPSSASEGDLLGSFESRPAKTSRARPKSNTPPTSSSSKATSTDGTNAQREALRQKTEAEIKARAAEKLAAVKAREDAKAAEQERKDDARAGAERRINQWTGNGARRGNLRALLASLDTVLYPGHTWKSVQMDVLRAPAKVKLYYRKAILQVHPDKIGPKKLPPDQQMLAELIFDELQNGHEVFTAEQEGRPPPAGSVGPKKAPGGMGGAAGFAKSGSGMYPNMGRGMGGMGGMGGFGMGGMPMGRGMNGMGAMGRGMNGFGGMAYGANGRGNMPFGAGRAYGMGMHQQQRR